MARRRGIAACCLAVVFAGAAGAQPPPTESFRGSSLENAIVLPGVADEFHGAVAEHGYIAEHFSAWHIEYQARIVHGDRAFDEIGMVKPDKTKVPVFFDVTPWQGR
jgi:hypothetical protein